MIIKTFIEPPIDNNNYLLVDEITRDAALIDCSSIDIWDKVPSGFGNVVSTPTGENREELENINLKYILLTHGHFDHIAGIRDGKAAVFMHSSDLDWLKKVNQFMPMFGMPDMSVPKIDKFVEDGEIIKLGSLEIKVLHTPGHTQGGVCYLVGNIVFSGDTVFRESVGRCDLEGGDFDQLVKSIETKLYTLPDDIKIYPGHGKPTTVGWEKLHNRFL